MKRLKATAGSSGSLWFSKVWGVEKVSLPLRPDRNTIIEILYKSPVIANTLNNNQNVIADLGKLLTVRAPPI